MIETRRLGIQDYASAYDLQKGLVEKKKKDTNLPDYVLLLEHPDVYTYGRRNKEAVKHLNAPSFFIERGGDVTYHNPGQLVAYPIIQLPESKRDLHAYLRTLEEAIISTLLEFGVRGERKLGATGVWIVGKNKKIASIGVAASSWITYHGIALNVCNDLSGFKKINPCGFDAAVMTSMQEELSGEVEMQQVIKILERFLSEKIEAFISTKGMS